MEEFCWRSCGDAAERWETNERSWTLMWSQHQVTGSSGVRAWWERTASRLELAQFARQTVTDSLKSSQSWASNSTQPNAGEGRATGPLRSPLSFQDLIWCYIYFCPVPQKTACCLFPGRISRHINFSWINVRLSALLNFTLGLLPVQTYFDKMPLWYTTAS